jgi:hypothetical protein
MVVKRILTTHALNTIWMTTWQMSCTCRQRYETGKVSAGPRWQGSGPQLTSLILPWAWWWLHGGLSPGSVSTGTWTHGGHDMSTGVATLLFNIGDQHHWTTSRLWYLHSCGSFLDRNQAYLRPLFMQLTAWDWLTCCCSLGYQPHAADTCDGSLYHEYDESYDFREGSPRRDDFHHH